MPQLTSACIVLASIATCSGASEFLKSTSGKEVAAAQYVLIGYGTCVDAHGQQYESWTADQPDWLYFTGNASTCICQGCAAVCDQHAACVGYEFYCCPSGVRCIAGAHILFDKGQVPRAEPPAGFSTKGYMGISTIGDNYQGEGPIVSIPDGVAGDWNSKSGGRKCLKKV